MAPSPPDETVVFPQSSFFTQHPKPSQLPSAAEIRRLAIEANAAAAEDFHQPPPVAVPALGLLVKYGARVSVAEARCLAMLRERLAGRVPVPEVYGWRRDRGQVFIYMELVRGATTLERGWDSLGEEARAAVCGELGGMVRAWRGLAREEDGVDSGISHVGNEPLLDTVFTSSNAPKAGPFQGVAEFHDWFTSTIGPPENWGKLGRHPYRDLLPDDVPIVFTHADLHPSNILISPGPAPRVVAVVDWEQAGWYPAYWEYCKARWTAKANQEEWDGRYLPMIVDGWEDEVYDNWDYFVLCRGV
ncbi:hypothetical protein AK830_g1152 [Neonectria ditissima]|uniref:Aminoglycoside phosphotransferase domain-containing protein n=1 Tax=Neonectria ditissima TaxID=78410 RepID=A0A0N8H8S3_9HYPO|nr:hypothetical protein AK830_g1152 [Neonectria ditissima]